MRNGRSKIDIPYLAVFSGILGFVVVASLWLFPEWRESPAQIALLIGTAVIALVGLAASFRSAFMPDKKDVPFARLDYDAPNHHRNQENVVANVRAANIDGVLAESLPERIRLDLRLDSPPNVLRRSLHRAPDREALQPLATAADIADIFRRSGRALLILGAPGSGKTITLIELCAPLLGEAQDDPRQPVPVILNLSTWAQKSGPLEEWIVEEMWRQYGLNKQVTPVWLAADHLILLLDGLDEVAPDARDACVQAINIFKENHGAGLAVCSRSADYTDLSERLALSHAVEIQPLTDAQVEAYLSHPELRLSAVCEAIARDDALRELSTAPLMLNVMAMAYGGRQIEELIPLLDSETEHRAHLYDRYIERAFMHRPLENVGYSAAQALGWLRFIAEHLTSRNETQFFVEDLQLEWLQGRQSVLFVALGTILGGAIGALIGVIIGLMELQNFLLIDLYNFLGGLVNNIHPFVSGNALYGFVFGSLLGLFLVKTPFEPVDELDVDVNLQSIRKASREIILYSVAGSVTYTTLSLITYIVLESQIGAFANFLLYGRLFGWWLGVGLSVLFGGLIGFLFGTLFSLIHPVQSKRRIQPNHGIRRSALNGARSGLVLGALFSVAAVWLFGIAGGIPFGIMGGVLSSGFAGTLMIALLGFLAAGLIYGGAAVIKHYLLRIFFHLNDLLPLRLIPFLDAMRDRILLQRAGAYYRFIHRTFQEHIAGLTDERIAELTQGERGA